MICKDLHCCQKIPTLVTEIELNLALENHKAHHVLQTTKHFQTQESSKCDPQPERKIRLSRNDREDDLGNKDTETAVMKNAQLCSRN